MQRQLFLTAMQRFKPAIQQQQRFASNVSSKDSGTDFQLFAIGGALLTAAGYVIFSALSHEPAAAKHATKE